MVARQTFQFIPAESKASWRSGKHPYRDYLAMESMFWLQSPTQTGMCRTLDAIPMQFPHFLSSEQPCTVCTVSSTARQQPPLYRYPSPVCIFIPLSVPVYSFLRLSAPCLHFPTSLCSLSAFPLLPVPYVQIAPSVYCVCALKGLTQL